MQRIPLQELDDSLIVAPVAGHSSVAHFLSIAEGMPPDTVKQAQAMAARVGRPVDDILYTHFGWSRRAIAEALAESIGSQLVDPLRHPPDPRLIAQLGAARCVRMGLLPWRRFAGCIVVLCASQTVFETHRLELTRLFGPVRLAISTDDQIKTSIRALFGPQLVRRAEARVSTDESCREWHAPAMMRWLVGLGLALLAATVIAPQILATGLILLCVTVLALTNALKLAAAFASRDQRQQTTPHPPLPEDCLPVITLLIPLFKEREIAEHLLARLEAIDYPRELLDVCLVLEAGDHTTRTALGRARLLTWMRPIVVPDGTIKTKPRALNYALDFARGSIIGVYDAEDAPATDQLRIVAHHFHHAKSDVACVQGVLDYYNSQSNWLTRCFTIEYAAWFRVVLPGYARMGLVVPLGGTTLFFSRAILERLGGWDAHNVTEDADLGIRLARHGYRTEFMASVTQEEANGRAWPWVKQRSRWLKGYAITYGVHMRDPRALLRNLGLWRFVGLQIMFAGTLVQFLLSPVLWSFWLLPFAVTHPAEAVLPKTALLAMIGLFIASECANLVVSWLGLHRAGKARLWPWALTLQLYFPLGSIATYKGLVELAWKPFFWDKTAHGVLLPKSMATLPPPPSERLTSGG